jgi:hypothetical protein
LGRWRAKPPHDWQSTAGLCLSMSDKGLHAYLTFMSIRLLFRLSDFFCVKTWSVWHSAMSRHDEVSRTAHIGI